MKFLRKLKFIWKYDIDYEFVVYSAPDQLASRFLKFEDAEKFANSQIQHRPKVFVAVNRRH